MAETTYEIHLVSVNNTPSKAIELVSKLAKNLKDSYQLIHVANSETISGLEQLLTALVTPPRLLICSSQWTEHEQADVLNIARSVLPDIALITIPPGLHANRGDKAVVEFLEEEVKRSGLSKLD